jgi:hypothetical protein
MELRSDVATLRVSPDTFIMRFLAPEYFFQMKYSDITANVLHGLRLIAATRPSARENILGISRNVVKQLPINANGADSNADDLRVVPGDIFICIGSTASYKSLYRFIN